MINVVVLCLILCLMYCMISKGRVLEVLESIFWKLGFVDLPEAAEGWRAHVMGGLPPRSPAPKTPSLLLPDRGAFVRVGPRRARQGWARLG